MTTHDDDIEGGIDGHDTDAKLALQQRRQLSALVDGDLAPEQARFLLRRLGHDRDLAGRWHRWQLIGDVMRGQAVAALPAGPEGFPVRVAEAIAREGARPAPGVRRRWQHGIGLAAAASVAAVALFIAPPVSVDSELPGNAAVVASSPPAQAVDPGPAPGATMREVSVPQFAESTPAPVAPTRGREPVPGPRPLRREPPREPVAAIAAAPGDGKPAIAASVAATGDVPEVAPTVVLASAGTDAGERPFASLVEPQARPWPRAAVPGLPDPAGGRFTVGFDDTVQAPSFYPFEPQLPERAADPERTR